MLNPVTAGPGHLDAHNRERDAINGLQSRLNAAIYASDCPSLQAAVNDAAARAIPAVICDPVATYTLTETLVIPKEVHLYGGGGGGTSNHPASPRIRAKITTSAALNPMVKLDHYAGIHGFNIDGQGRAVCGILLDNTVAPIIEHNFFQRLHTAVRAGGAIYGSLTGNSMNQITGYGLDGLALYSSTPGAVYYGWQHFLSQGNQYAGNVGFVRFDGIMTSIQDDFERTDNSTEYAVKVGSAYQSQLTMIQPYFELAKGTQSVKGIWVNNNSKCTLVGGQAFGQANDDAGIFAFLYNPDLFSISGAFISRFGIVYEGSVKSFSVVNIAPCLYYLNDVINSVADIATCNASLVVLPGTHLGDV